MISQGRPNRETVPAWTKLTIMMLMVLGLGFGAANAQPSNSLDNSVIVEGSVNATADRGGRAVNIIGSGTQSGVCEPSSTYVGGPVLSISNGGNAIATIGDGGCGGSSYVGEGVTNMDGEAHVGQGSTVTGKIITMPRSEARVGGCSDANLLGDLIVLYGNVELGCGCVARRNDKCCVEVHRTICVISKVPPTKHGCPPNHTYTGDWCRWYLDYDHSIGSGSLF